MDRKSFDRASEIFNEINDLENCGGILEPLDRLRCIFIKTKLVSLDDKIFDEMRENLIQKIEDKKRRLEEELKNL
jgi:hypothetical protein